jgi:hypothetical protein
MAVRSRGVHENRFRNFLRQGLSSFFSDKTVVLAAMALGLLARLDDSPNLIGAIRDVTRRSSIATLVET